MKDTFSLNGEPLTGSEKFRQRYSDFIEINCREVALTNDARTRHAIILLASMELNLTRNSPHSELGQIQKIRVPTGWFS